MSATGARRDDGRLPGDLLCRCSLAILDAPSPQALVSRTADAACALGDAGVAVAVLQPSGEAGHLAQSPRWRARPASPPAHTVPLRSRDGRVLGALHVWSKADVPSSPDREIVLYCARLAALVAETGALASTPADDGAQPVELARMMQEIRTPIAAMLAWTWALRHGLDAARAERALDGLERCARAQAALLDRLPALVRSASDESSRAVRAGVRRAGAGAERAAVPPTSARR